ncbi:winged helix-turn-helix domain-containing protein [Actinoplanes sp. NBRC 103695]|uniref:winged helix-turn-helix domain-containing protein n=1 Tax=Actinoplanes sp. NBRC 103695 TaxID=3032202 RepID=UPI0025573069|nr:winged helix-turn-helix domain-containing protein [Actinoplanes sp. NBRC 103695]
MPVTALKGRSGRHSTRAARVPAARRASEPTSFPQVETPATAPSLTLTITIPMTEQELSPEAQRLIDAVRDLAEAGGQVAEGPAALLPADLAATPAAGPEVSLLISSRQVLVDGEALPLTRLEFELLQFLASNRRRVFTRAQLLAGVWGYEHTGERTVDVHVRRLRLKLGPQVPLVTTVYGVGYRLADDANIVVRPHD